MGTCYKFGWGVEINYDIAMKWYLTAAGNGSGEGMYELGEWYRFGGHGVEKDLEKARQWYEKCVAAGEDYVSNAQDALERMDGKD